MIKERKDKKENGTIVTEIKGKKGKGMVLKERKDKI